MIEFKLYSVHIHYSSDILHDGVSHKTYYIYNYFHGLTFLPISRWVVLRRIHHIWVYMSRVPTVTYFCGLVVLYTIYILYIYTYILHIYIYHYCVRIYTDNTCWPSPGVIIRGTSVNVQKDRQWMVSEFAAAGCVYLYNPVLRIVDTLDCYTGLRISF